MRSKIAYRWAWGDPTLQGSNGRCDPSYRCLSGNSLGRISLIGDCFRSNNNNMAAGKSWGSGCWFQGDCATGLVCLVEEDGACKFYDSLVICINDYSFQ